MSIIQETENYSLAVGKPVESKDNLTIYQITNKKYGVIEVETTMLPQAIKYLNDLEAGLAAVQDMFKEPSPLITPAPKRVIQ